MKEEQRKARQVNKELLKELITKALDERKWILLHYQGVKYSPRELNDEIEKEDGRFFHDSNYGLIDPPDITPEHFKAELYEITKKHESLIRRVDSSWGL